MQISKPSGVAIAIIRAVVDPGTGPLIRILKVTDLSTEEHCVADATSVDEATGIVTAWLRDVIRRNSVEPCSRDDAPVTRG